MIDSGVAKLWKHAYRDEAAAVARLRRPPQRATQSKSDQASLTSIARQKTSPFRAATPFASTAGERRRTHATAFRRPRPRKEARRQLVGHRGRQDAGRRPRLPRGRQPVYRCLLPNSVVEGWCEKIREVFPDSSWRRTFAPDWTASDPESHRYLVLNYEAFQQPDSGRARPYSCRSAAIDFIVVDEIHYAKRRGENVSKRRELVRASTVTPANATRPCTSWACRPRRSSTTCTKDGAWSNS